MCPQLTFGLLFIEVAPCGARRPRRLAHEPGHWQVGAPMQLRGLPDKPTRGIAITNARSATGAIVIFMRPCLLGVENHE